VHGHDIDSVLLPRRMERIGTLFGDRRVSPAIRHLREHLEHCRSDIRGTLGRALRAA